jgi:hypothetical protein
LEVCAISDDVEVRKGGLDHEEVSAFERVAILYTEVMRR